MNDHHDHHDDNALPAVRDDPSAIVRHDEAMTFEQMMQQAAQVAESGLFRDIDTPAKAFVCMQTCTELGLPAVSSMQHMHVINGKVGLDGSLALAMVRRSGRCKWIRWGVGGEEGKDDRHAWVESERSDMPGQVNRTEFSVGDAKRAGLWMKKGSKGQDTPWITYPKRMMHWRALGFHLRDHYSDVMHGLDIAEELQDYPRPQRRQVEARQTPIHDPLMDAAKQAEDDASDDAEQIVDFDYQVVEDAEPQPKEGD